MLYDQRWGKGTPSLAGFKAWLERQDPDETFNYIDCKRCAVGQYLASIGTSWNKADSGMVERLNAFAMRARDGVYTKSFGEVLREIEHDEALELAA